jgi:hypothetical protein
MQAIRKAIAAGQEDRLPSLMSDRWLSQVTLSAARRTCATASRPGTRQA